MKDNETPKRIVVSGASGLLGTALREVLSARGDDVVRLVRGEPKSKSEVAWDPDEGTIDRDALKGADAFIHLSGESVSEGRWSEDQKRRIVESRTKSTSLIARTIAELDPQPKAFVSAAGIGIYGAKRGDEVLDETSSYGDDFLADVCKQWEAASTAAKEAGIRTVNLRIGVVLTPKGAALAKLLPFFKMGVGGPVGDGKQYLSWISLTDTIAVVYHCLDNEKVVGPVNVVGPDPMTNRDFAKVLGHVLGRPSFFPAPRAMIELLFGEMGRETILASQRVLPKKLDDTGFVFAHKTLEAALRHELGRE